MKLLSQTSFPKEIVIQQTLSFYELVESSVNNPRQKCNMNVKTGSEVQLSTRNSIVAASALTEASTMTEMNTL